LILREHFVQYGIDVALRAVAPVCFVGAGPITPGNLCQIRRRVGIFSQTIHRSCSRMDYLPRRGRPALNGAVVPPLRARAGQEYPKVATRQLSTVPLRDTAVCKTLSELGDGPADRQ
jgi:hypothetical protein